MKRTLQFIYRIITFIVLLIFLNIYCFSQNRTLNTSLPVGTLAGSANVTPSGAATYSIPIIVPTGTNGMQPGLSINYNSQSTTGLLGMGATLSGIPSITRIPTSFYHDRSIDGVNFNSSDMFALNGQRLIVTSGTYGANNSEYHTEVESFTKVNSYGTAGSGPQYFIAVTKDGTTMEFGNTSDSRIEAQGRSDILFWNVNKITDVHGNYIKFTYYENNSTGESRIERIDYTGNDYNNLQPYASVNFIYIDRDDPYDFFVEGCKVRQNKILQSIKTMYGTTQVKEYRFNYTYDKGMKLTEVIEKDKDGNAFNSTKLEWGTINWNLAQNTPISNSRNNIFHFGDFNGDGRTDFVVLEKKTSYTSNDKWDLYIANNDGSTYTLRSSENLSYNFLAFEVADLNGDGFDDLVKQESGTNYLYTPMLFNAQGYTKGNDIIVYGFGDQKFRMGDFNGDGLSEILVVETLTGRWNLYSYLLYSNNGVSPNISMINSGTLSGWSSGMDLYTEIRDVFLDFDGDGKTDLMLITQSGSNFYNLGNPTPKLTLGYPKLNDEIVFGDFNGDGKTDWLNYQKDKGKWFLYYSTGKAVIESDLSSYCALPSIEYNTFYAGNINGDNLSDLIINGFGPSFPGLGITTGYHFLINKGNGFTPAGSIFPSTLPIVVSEGANTVIDMNGDGISDIFFNYMQNVRNFCFTNGSDNNKVVSIYNGLNALSQFEYKPITRGDVYTKGSGETYPNMDYTGPVYVVNKLTESNGIGGNTVTSYTYANAKMNLQGLGFLGFMETYVNQETFGIKTTNYFEKKNYTDASRSMFYYLPHLYKSVVQTSAGGAISEATGSLSITALPNNALLTYESRTTSYDAISNVNRATSQVMDNSGNITSSTSEIVGQGGISITNENFNSYGSPGRVTKVYTRTNQPTETRIKDFIYFNNGDTKTAVTDPGKYKSVTTTYEYNTYGNLTKTVISATGINSRTFQSVYDSKGRFLEKEINALNHFTEYSYDDVLGVPDTVKDINSHQTTYTYDGFGRLKKVVSPDGVNSTIDLIWVTTGPQYAVYKSKKSVTGQSDAFTFYDMLGRPIQVETSGFDGTKVILEQKYNEKGLLFQSSEPYYEGGNTRWTTNRYDYLNRLEKIEAPSATITYTYNGRTTTVKNETSGRTVTQVKNAFGENESSTDAGGTITYTYNSLGLPKTINAAGQITTIGYDEYGNQNSLDEPNSGTTAYVYNAFKELIMQTNSRSQTYELTYDDLGRLNNKSGPEGITTYKYDTEVNGKGGLATITSPGNISYRYKYDEFSRPNIIEKTIDGVTYITTSSFVNGKLSSIAYPSGFSVNYSYNSYGYLSEILRGDNSSRIWKAESYNALGQNMQSLFGNGLRSYRTYDPNHFLHTMVTDNVQNLEFGFDASTGDLKYRKDAKRNLTESFNYDDLDRLNKITFNGVEQAIVYGANGNIQSKYGLGNYTYDNTKLNAVTEVQNGGLLGLDQQNITYTTSNKVQQITQNNITADFIYGPEDERIKMTITGANNLTRYYIGNYEKEVTSGGTKELHYISNGTEIVAIYEKVNNQMYYVHPDHLGSLNVITNQNGTIEEEQSFDAWGKRRNVNDWSSIIPASFRFYRGYTGHEHLDQFQLINMNGRMYDPVLARFLSPDKFIQSPDFTQSYNLYSYCVNNPLKYTDPSGWNYTGEYSPWDLPPWAQQQRNYYQHTNNPHDAELSISRWINETSPTGNTPGGQALNIFRYENQEIMNGAHYSKVRGQYGYVDQMGTTKDENGVVVVKARWVQVEGPKANLGRSNNMSATGDYSYPIQSHSNGGGSDGVWTIGISGTAALTVVGFNFQIGVVVDFKDGAKESIRPYLTLGRSSGIDASIGVAVTYNKPFNSAPLDVYSVRGWGSSINGAFLIFDGSKGGDQYYKGFSLDKTTLSSINYKSYGGGVSYGLPLGASVNKTYTWVW